MSALQVSATFSALLNQRTENNSAASDWSLTGKKIQFQRTDFFNFQIRVRVSGAEFRNQRSQVWS